MKKNNSVRKVTVAALFAAMTFVGTIVHIHIPGMITGYVNLGDCFVLVSGILLGPLYGAFAAGIGAGMADFLHGYMYYVPATFVIKALMAVVAYYLYYLFSKGKKEYKTCPLVISGIVAEIIMIFGYFFYEGAVMPGINYAAAALGILGNFAQAVLGIVLSVIVIRVMKKTNVIEMI